MRENEKKCTLSFVLIDGAVSMSDARIEGEMLHFPEVNSEYKYFSVCKQPNGVNFPYVSKDLKKWSVPVAVSHGGKIVNAIEFEKAYTYMSKMYSK